MSYLTRDLSPILFGVGCRGVGGCVAVRMMRLQCGFSSLCRQDIVWVDNYFLAHNIRGRLLGCGE